MSFGEPIMPKSSLVTASLLFLFQTLVLGYPARAEQPAEPHPDELQQLRSEINSLRAQLDALPRATVRTAASRISGSASLRP